MANTNNFPANPTDGQTFVAADGVTFIYDADSSLWNFLAAGTDVAGISLYNSANTYSTNDIVRSSTTGLYISITDSNTGNALTNVQHWLSLGGATQFAPESVTSTHFATIGIPNDTVGANLILSKNNLVDGLSPTPNRSVEIFGTGGIDVIAHGERDVIEIDGSSIGPGGHITTSGTGPNVVGVDKTGDNVTNLQLGTISAGAEALNDLTDVDTTAEDTNNNVLFYNPTTEQWFASDSFTRLVHSVDTLKEQINLLSHSVTDSVAATRVNDALRSIIAVDNNPADDAEYDYVHNQLLWRVEPQTNSDGTFIQQAQAANAYREAGGVFAVSKNALPNDAALVVDANDVYYFRLTGFQATGQGSNQYNVIAQLIDITGEDQLISDYAFSSGTAGYNSWFFNINNVVFDHMTAVDAGSGIVGITEREATLLGYLDVAANTTNNGDYLTIDELGAIVATDAPTTGIDTALRELPDTVATDSTWTSYITKLGFTGDEIPSGTQFPAVADHTPGDLFILTAGHTQPADDDLIYVGLYVLVQNTPTNEWVHLTEYKTAEVELNYPGGSENVTLYGNKGVEDLAQDLLDTTALVYNNMNQQLALKPDTTATVIDTDVGLNDSNEVVSIRVGDTVRNIANDGTGSTVTYQEDEATITIDGTTVVPLNQAHDWPATADVPADFELVVRQHTLWTYNNRAWLYLFPGETIAAADLDDNAPSDTGVVWMNLDRSAVLDWPSSGTDSFLVPHGSLWAYKRKTWEYVSADEVTVDSSNYSSVTPDETDVEWQIQSHDIGSCNDILGSDGFYARYGITNQSVTENPNDRAEAIAAYEAMTSDELASGNFDDHDRIHDVGNNVSVIIHRTAGVWSAEIIPLRSEVVTLIEAGVATHETVKSVTVTSAASSFNEETGALNVSTAGGGGVPDDFKYALLLTNGFLLPENSAMSTDDRDAYTDTLGVYGSANDVFWFDNTDDSWYNVSTGGTALVSFPS